MLQRVKTAVLLVLVYSAVTYLGMRVMMVPSVSGLWPSFWPSGGFFRRNWRGDRLLFWRTSYDASAHSLFGRLFV